MYTGNILFFIWVIIAGTEHFLHRRYPEGKQQAKRLLFYIHWTFLLAGIIILCLIPDINTIWPILCMLAIFIKAGRHLQHHTTIWNKKRFFPILYLLCATLSIGITRLYIEWGKIDTWDYAALLKQYGLFSFILTSLFFALSGLRLLPSSAYQKRKLEEMQLQEQLSQVRLETLYAKINPEFLHHSLQTIANRALTDGEMTREMSLCLSRYFRYCMNKEERHLVAPDEEIEMTRIFLEFEQKHYPGKLSWQINIPTETSDVLIPRLLLQSLSDYCIRRAQATPITHLHLTLELQTLPSGLVVFIHPHPLSLSDSELKTSSLQNICQKLDLILPHACLLNIHPAPANEIIVLIKSAEYA